MGRFPDEVSLEGDMLKTGSQSVKLIAERNPSSLPWGELGIDYKDIFNRGGQDFQMQKMSMKLILAMGRSR